MTDQPARVPRYRQIADELRHAIATADLPPGAYLPSYREAEQRWGVARTVAQNAAAVLRAEGLVEEVTGRGYRVRRRRPRRMVAADRFARARAMGMPVGFADVAAEGGVPAMTILYAGPGPVPAAAAVRLDVDEGAQVLVRDRTVAWDGEPVEHSTSYFPLDVAAADGPLASPAPLVPGGVAGAMAELGHPYAVGLDELEARAATPQERRLLHVPDGVPVVQVWETVWDRAGRPVEAVVKVYVADRHRFVQEVRIDDPR